MTYLYMLKTETIPSISDVPSTRDEGEKIHQSLISPLCNTPLEAWRALAKKTKQNLICLFLFLGLSQPNSLKTLI